jgi:hypothetical protein
MATKKTDTTKTADTAKWEKWFKAEPRVSATEKGLQESIKAIIDEVDGYYLTHAFEAGSEGQTLDVHSFTRGDHAISPQVLANAKRFDELCDTILEAIPNVDEKVRYAISRLDELYTSLGTSCERGGYYIGVLLGARLMGASRDELERLGDGLYRHLKFQANL